MWWHTPRNQISSFGQNGRVHLNRLGLQFSRLLAAELCASAVVMLDTPCSEVVWRVLATHSIRQFPLHFPYRASTCAITFQQEFYLLDKRPVRSHNLSKHCSKNKYFITTGNQNPAFSDTKLFLLLGNLSFLRLPCTLAEGPFTFLISVYSSDPNTSLENFIIIFLHGLGRLTCSGINELPSFPGASTISSSSVFAVEGVLRQSGVVHYFKVVDTVLFVFESHVLYSRDL